MMIGNRKHLQQLVSKMLLVEDKRGAMIAILYVRFNESHNYLRYAQPLNNATVFNHAKSLVL